MATVEPNTPPGLHGRRRRACATWLQIGGASCASEKETTPQAGNTTYLYPVRPVPEKLEQAQARLPSLESSTRLHRRFCVGTLDRLVVDMRQSPLLLRRSADPIKGDRARETPLRL